MCSPISQNNSIQLDLKANSNLHSKMISIAFPNREGIYRRWRKKGLTKFHIQKILFVIRQKRFATRLVNYITYYIQRYKYSEVKYLPPTVQMDVSTGCPLKCPCCITGISNTTDSPIPITAVNIEKIKNRIDGFYKRSIQVFFHMHYEPLLNKDVFDAVKYATSKGLWTGFHTNLIPNVTNLSEKIINSKICNLVVSIDGASQKVYEKYRVGGNVEMVFKKMKEIAVLKKQTKSSFPIITAKFLIFDHNWYEIEDFKTKAMENGADEVVYVSAFANGTYATGQSATEIEFNLNTLKWEAYHLPEKCGFIWDDLRIHTDGSLFSCGNGYKNEHRFYINDDENNNYLAGFNSPYFKQIRNFYLKKNTQSNLASPCISCRIVENFNK